MSCNSLFPVVSDMQLGSPATVFHPGDVLYVCMCVCAFLGKRTFLTRISLLYPALQQGKACKLTLLVTDECQNQSTDLCHLLRCKGLPVPRDLALLAEQKVGSVVCLASSPGPSHCCTSWERAWYATSHVLRHR